jgi:hypothetical protein
MPIVNRELAWYLRAAGWVRLAGWSRHGNLADTPLVLVQRAQLLGGEGESPRTNDPDRLPGALCHEVPDPDAASPIA